MCLDIFLACRPIYRLSFTFVAQRKAEVNGKKFSLRLLIVSEIATQQFLCFFADFRATNNNAKDFYLFPVLPRFCRKAKKFRCDATKKTEVNPNEKKFFRFQRYKRRNHTK